MVGCNSYRQPSLLAKITSTVDVISGGRLDWGIGAGWYENEYRGYGYEFPAAKDRIGMLRETVEIVRSMWTNPETTYDGQHYQLRRANCDPKPVQTPHPPIWIGGGGEQLTLRVVARYADCSNFGGKPDEFAHKCEILKGHCASVGRDYDEIRKTWSPEVFVRETEAEVAAAGTRSLWGEPVESWRSGNLVGTPEQVAEKIQTYVDLGCTGFIPWCADYPDTTSLELLATRSCPSSAEPVRGGRRPSDVVPVDHLGHAGRLGRALDLEDQGDRAAGRRRSRPRRRPASRRGAAWRRRGPATGSGPCWCRSSRPWSCR